MADTEAAAVHEPAQNRFTVTMDGVVAELVYERYDDVLVLAHTGVPVELGGQGIGGILVKAAVDAAAREGLGVRPDCSFAGGWLEKHPDEAARVTVLPSEG